MTDSIHIFHPDAAWPLYLERSLTILSVCVGIEAKVESIYPGLTVQRGSMAAMLEYAKEWIATDYAEHVSEQPSFDFTVGIERPRIGPNCDVVELYVALCSNSDPSLGRILYGVTFVRGGESQYSVYEVAGIWMELR